MKTKIKVDNLKCGGCASTIKKSLLQLKGITQVDVLPDEDEVLIVYENDEQLRIAKEKLLELGYPETGTTKGLEATMTNLKSYLSCAIGKVGKKEN
jgi:copper chaperone